MRVGGLGDILMGTPLLSALRNAYPDAHLTWISEHSHVQAIDANPYIDEYVRWDGAFFTRPLRKGNYFTWLWRMLLFCRMMRQRKYDVFISFQPEEWALLTLGIGSPVSIGVFDTFRRYYRAKQTSRNTRFYSHAYAHPHLPPSRTDQYLLPLQALNLPAPPIKHSSMGFTEEDACVARDFLTSQGVSMADALVILAPMTTWPTKCWPPERYAQLGDILSAKYNCRCIIIGGPGEENVIQQAAAAMKVRPAMAAGTLSYREIAALIAAARLVVSGDTGPMHIAAAVGTPYVALFGPTSPQWYAPAAGDGVTLSHAVLCGPCDQKLCPFKGDEYQKCMRLITVSEVLEAAETLLKIDPTAKPERCQHAHGLA